MKFSLIASLIVLTVTSIASADVPVPLFQVETHVYMRGAANGSDEDKVDVPIFDKNFTVYNTSCSINFDMINWVYGPVLTCKSASAENAFAITARCDVRQPGATNSNTVGIFDPTGQVSNIRLECKTTYDRVKNSPKANKKTQAI